MIVIDEYLAIRSVAGVLPADLLDEPLALTTSAHWRILQRIHAPGTGQLSQALGALSLAGRQVLRKPAPAVLEVLDPRPLLDQAAEVATAYGNTGWLVSAVHRSGRVDADLSRLGDAEELCRARPHAGSLILGPARTRTRSRSSYRVTTTIPRA